MPQLQTEYVQRTAEGGWRISNSRVSLDSVVHAYWEGMSPEAIVEDFPTLSAEQVHGALAFYLHNKVEVDQYLRTQEQQWQVVAAASEAQHGPLLDRLRNSRAPANGTPT